MNVQVRMMEDGWIRFGQVCGRWRERERDEEELRERVSCEKFVGESGWAEI